MAPHRSPPSELITETLPGRICQIPLCSSSLLCICGTDCAAPLLLVLVQEENWQKNAQIFFYKNGKTTPLSAHLPHFYQHVALPVCCSLPLLSGPIVKPPRCITSLSDLSSLSSRLVQVVSFPGDFSCAVAGLIFLEYSASAQWSAELLVITYGGGLKSYLVR